MSHFNPYIDPLASFIRVHSEPVAVSLHDLLEGLFDLPVKQQERHLVPLIQALEFYGWRPCRVDHRRYPGLHYAPAGATQAHPLPIWLLSPWRSYQYPYGKPQYFEDAPLDLLPA